MDSQSENEDLNVTTSSDENETEAITASDLGNDDTKTAEEVHGTDNAGNYVPRCALVFYIMAFFGFFCAFMLRVSLSVAIVAMVNQTAITEDMVMFNTSDTVGQCPRDPALHREGGEFVWDRNQQGALLAAFYYGHILTQVKTNGLAFYTTRK